MNYCEYTVGIGFILSGRLLLLPPVNGPKQSLCWKGESWAGSRTLWADHRTGTVHCSVTCRTLLSLFWFDNKATNTCFEVGIKQQLLWEGCLRESKCRLMQKYTQQQEAAVTAGDKKPGMAPWREPMGQRKQGFASAWGCPSLYKHHEGYPDIMLFQSCALH